MKTRKEKRCPFCDEYLVYDRSLARYGCPNCSIKTVSYLKQIKHQQYRLARKIYEMVKSLSGEDLIKLYQNENANNTFCIHCKPDSTTDNGSGTDEDTTVPDVPPIILDANFGRHRRKHH